MRYHDTSARVAAPPTSRAPASVPLSPAERRQQLRAEGSAFETMLREDLCAIADNLPCSPQPRMMLADLRRGRAASLTTVGAVIVLLAERPECATALDALADRLAAWIRSHTRNEPTCLHDAWRDETQRQGVADVALAELFTSPSLASVDRATAATAEHIAVSRDVLEQLKAKRRRLAGERSLKVVRS